MISGIIAEYNIFHNGHKYMIDTVKKHSDAIVAVMSGSFVQRGDVAIADKWTRAKTALLNGVDLVVELPICYALNAAPNFASGAVSILDLLGVDELAFGSECGDVSIITKAAAIMENEEKNVSNSIKNNITQGLSYAEALTDAYKSVISPDILTSPNNILAVEYCRALIKNKSSIKPFTLTRAEAAHDGETISKGFASASKIRGMLFNKEDISSLIPYNIDILEDHIPYTLSRLDTAVIAKLRTVNADYLCNISEVTEGLENRIIDYAIYTDGFSALANAVKSKRYTLSKIRRILIAALLDFTKDIYLPHPEYIRILGMNKTGMNILKRAKKNCSVPIITKTADFKDKSKQFELDIRASNIAALCHPTHHDGNADFKTSPIIVNKK